LARPALKILVQNFGSSRIGFSPWTDLLFYNFLW